VGRKAYIFERALAVCEEFCDHLYTDKENYSFLVNCKPGWFDKLANRLLSIGFRLVNKIEMEKSITATFVYNSKVTSK